VEHNIWREEHKARVVEYFDPPDALVILKKKENDMNSQLTPEVKAASLAIGKRAEPRAHT
jgi:hypothetical protein